MPRRGFAGVPLEKTVSKLTEETTSRSKELFIVEADAERGGEEPLRKCL